MPSALQNDDDQIFKMMSEVLPTFSREEAEKVEDHIFRIYDINNDGVVDFHEFMTVFMILTGRNRGFMKLIFISSQLWTIDINRQE